MALSDMQSALDRVLYSAGYALEHLESSVVGKVGAVAPEADAHEHDEGPVPVPVADEQSPEEALLTALASTAGAWLLARMLRPRDVCWPRAVLAGLAGTAAFDVVRMLETNLIQHTDLPDEAAPAPAETAPLELLGRYAAGIGTAAAYASVLYPRIPAPRTLRGILFGAAEAATAERGGVVTMLRGAAPGIKLPLKGTARPLSGAATAVPHVVYGLMLGLLYRDDCLDD